MCGYGRGVVACFVFKVSYDPFGKNRLRRHAFRLSFPEPESVKLAVTASDGNLNLSLMKRAVVLTAAAMLGCFGPLTAYAQEAPNLKRGKSVKVEIMSKIDSNRAGEVTATVLADVTDDNAGRVLIGRGTPVTLTVERLKSKGFGKGGAVNVKTVSTVAVDGSVILLTGNLSKSSEDSSAPLAVGLATGLTVLPGFGFLFFCLKGERAVVPNGTIVDAFVADNYNVR